MRGEGTNASWSYYYYGALVGLIDWIFKMSTTVFSCRVEKGECETYPAKLYIKCSEMKELYLCSFPVRAPRAPRHFVSSFVSSHFDRTLLQMFVLRRTLIETPVSTPI